ncbi:hypothetical protein Hanom_Chr09g00871071 [Helianthus anomalus]
MSSKSLFLIFHIIKYNTISFSIKLCTVYQLISKINKIYISKYIHKYVYIGLGSRVNTSVACELSELILAIHVCRSMARI